jgi:hypothetical protein
MEPLRSSVVLELSSVLQPELDIADSAFPGTASVSSNQIKRTCGAEHGENIEKGFFTSSSMLRIRDPVLLCQLTEKN